MIKDLVENITSTRMNLEKHYWRVVKNAIISTTSLWLVFFLIKRLGDTYRSEWLTSGSVDIIAFFMLLCVWGLIMLLSLPIFLNYFDIVRNNTYLSFTSWLLIPTIIVADVVGKDILFRMEHSLQFGQDFLYLLSLCIPLMICLIYGYIKFRQEIDAR